jgi:adenylate cyclase
MPVPEPGYSASDISDVLDESLARYSGGNRLISGTTRRLMDGERRRIAVLFLDLTGFTRLSDNLDHEIVHGLVSRIMGCLSSVVESFGGYVDKFEGDRLMALFGAMASAENDSARAVSCALRMLDILEDVGPVFPGKDGITARIGIDFGSVTVAPDPTGHLTATGVTVNLASRIEEMTEPGSILVTEKVRHECGELFQFVRYGTTHIRDIRTPVELFTPLGPGNIQFERWQRAGRLSDIPMVNRVSESRKLESALNSALRDDKVPVLIKITGEAGIGKSRLLHNFLENASGVQILHGHARPYIQAPFWIWMDLMREFLEVENESSEEITEKVLKFADECGSSSLGEKLRQVSRVIADLLSMVRSDQPSESAEASQINTVALRLLLDAISLRGVVILALEDVHWIDKPSAEVLQLFLESGRHFNPVMVIATERPSEGTFSVMEGDWTIIDLKPLENDDISLITGFILSDKKGARPFEKDLEELVTRGAKGNPFFAEELVLGLLDSGGIRSDRDMQWGLSLSAEEVEMPSSVNSLIQTRIDKLPRNERKTLQLASIIGSKFSVPVLKRVVTELEFTIDISETLDSLIGKGFLTGNDGDRISFRHDLVQASAYSTMLKHNRRIVHRSIAQAIEALHPEEASILAPILFSHWRAAGEDQKTLEWGLKALASAIAHDQIKEMLDLTEIILDLTSEHTDENSWLAFMTALKARQGIMNRSGNISEAFNLTYRILSEARSHNNPKIEAEALRLECILLQESGNINEIADKFELALEKADSADDEMLKGKIYGSLANYLSDTGKSAEALEYYEKALEIQIDHDMRSNIGATLCNMGNVMTKLGRMEEAENCFKRSMEISRKLGSRSALGYSLNGYAISQAIHGNLKEAGDLFEEALECQIDIGNKALQSSILNNLGVLTKLLHQYDRSLEYREKALEVAREAQNIRSESISLLNIGNLYRLMGEPGKAIEFCRESLRLAVKISDPLSMCHSISVESMAEIDLGNAEAALSLYNKAVELIEENDIKPGMVEDFDELLTILSSGGISHSPPPDWPGKQG